MSLIKSIYKQYIDKKKIHENRVEKSQWEYHFNQILEKAIRLNSSDIIINILCWQYLPQIENQNQIHKTFVTAPFENQYKT